jgi:hypothetical protein
LPLKAPLPKTENQRYTRHHARVHITQGVAK